MKYKILMIVDETPPTPWAFWFSAQDMVKYMSKDFDFKILGYRDNLKDPKHNMGQYDLVYLFGHYMDTWVPDNFCFKKSCAGIRAEFGYCDDKSNPKQDPALCKEAQHILKYPTIHVVSDALYERFKNFHPKTYNICHGVDVNFFTPKPNYERDCKHGNFVLGWAGNPHNGYKNVGLLRNTIKKLSKDLSPKGHNIILKEAHYGEKYLNREQMRDFYHSLDAYIFPSKTEGTSATMLEAMSAGLPIIATPTGGWIELYNKTHGGFQIAGNEISIYNAVMDIIKLDEEKLFRMGKDNRKEMLDNWRWELKAKLFTKFFNDTIELNSTKDQVLDRTKKCFSFKWENMDKYGFPEIQKEFFVKWAIKKYGFSSKEELDTFFKSKKNILEVGCGSCFNIHYISSVTDAKITGIDLSEIAVKKAKKIFSDNPKIKIENADLMKLPFPDSSFDLIIADGVLHHTPNTKDALFAIYKKLSKDGHLYAYLYKKMGAIREFTNDWIREKVSKMTPDEALKYCNPITELGQSLAKFKEKIKIPNVEILGIPEGEYMVQEIFYYSILKCFWNDRFSFEENRMNNFDWYMPGYAWRQTKEDVETWLKELNCEFKINDSNPNGISILIKRR